MIELIVSRKSFEDTFAGYAPETAEEHIDDLGGGKVSITLTVTKAHIELKQGHLKDLVHTLDDLCMVLEG